MSERNYSDDAETNDGRVIVWGLQDLKESLDSLVEQQRIANLIALATTAQEHYRGYAGKAGFTGTLFDNPNTELGNMQLKPNIAAALGLNEGESDE